jgi:hypothetical protein
MTRHNMTVNEEEMEIPESAEILRRMTIQQIDGVRQQSFRRLIIMQNLIRAEHDEKGPIWDDWVERKSDHVHATYENFVRGLRVDDYQGLIDLSSDYFDMNPTSLEMSDRTAEDYLKTLKALEAN